MKIIIENVDWEVFEPLDNNKDIIIRYNEDRTRGEVYIRRGDKYVFSVVGDVDIIRGMKSNG